MKVLVIGGTGHIGTYLVPALTALGHDVTVMSRGQRRPYPAFGDWSGVTFVEVDRAAEDEAGTFGSRVAALDADVVVDLVCYTAESAAQLADALDGRVEHLLHCGSIWAHGASLQVPTTEDQPNRPLTEYGRGKAAIEAELLRRARRDGFPATVVHPGHISGPGWVPINPAGNVDVAIFQALADGDPVTLPDRGLGTLQHVHAADVAGVFLAAMANRSVAVGEAFHAVAPGAVTLRGYAEAVAGWFGRPAELRYLPFERWAETVSAEDARVTEDHLAHSPHCSMAKAQRLLGFVPRWTGLEAAQDAVRWLVDQGRITVDLSPSKG